MESIDSFFKVPESYKQEILQVLSSQTLVNTSDKIVCKACPENPNLVLVFVKGPLRSKQKDLKILYRTELPRDIYTECLKPVFSLSREDKKLILGKTLIDYSWVSMTYPVFDKDKSFLSLTTETNNLFYELPVLMKSIDSKTNVSESYLSHVIKHNKPLDKNSFCDTLFGLSYNKFDIPKLETTDYYTWYEDFSRHRPREYMISSPYDCETEEHLYYIYETSMINTAFGKPWMTEDEVEDYGNAFIISVFTYKDSEKADVQFNNKRLTTNKENAKKIFQKFGYGNKDPFVIMFWRSLAEKERMSCTVKLLDNDTAVLRLAMDKLKDTWKDVVEADKKCVDYIDCLLDYLVEGTINKSADLQLSSVFTLKNIKKLSSCTNAVYSGAAKVLNLLSTLHLLRHNVKYIMEHTDYQAVFDNAGGSFYHSCKLTSNYLDDLFNVTSENTNFNIGTLAELYAEEARTHYDFFTWITRLVHVHYKTEEAEVVGPDTDKRLYSYLKTLPEKLCIFGDGVDDGEEHDKFVVDLLLSEITAVGHTADLIDEPGDLPENVRNIIYDYLGCDHVESFD